ncbi:MAG: hypothetical protein RL441_1611, partial [Actinomycetota bacterium]
VANISEVYFDSVMLDLDGLGALRTFGASQIFG